MAIARYRQRVVRRYDDASKELEVRLPKLPFQAADQRSAGGFPHLMFCCFASPADQQRSQGFQLQGRQ
jgi:hypothetical protein